jgi:hypothetical protein
MDNTSEADNFWKAVISRTLTGGYNGKRPLILSKYFENGSEIPRPEDTSVLNRGLGEIKLQKADWRASFQKLDQGFHAVEFNDRYDCHIDKVDPDKDPIGHLVEDSPRYFGGTYSSSFSTDIGGYCLLFLQKERGERGGRGKRMKSRDTTRDLFAIPDADIAVQKVRFWAH